MTKLAEIQDAIRRLGREQQQRLRVWMSEAPLDLDEDSPELEAELLKAVESRHTPLLRDELEEIADKAVREHHKRKGA